MNEQADLLTFNDRQFALSHAYTFESSWFVIVTKSLMFLPFEYAVMSSAKCTKLSLFDDLKRSDI